MTGKAVKKLRHCERSEAIQSTPARHCERSEAIQSNPSQSRKKNLNFFHFLCLKREKVGMYYI
jgi:hypothetical protein